MMCVNPNTIYVKDKKQIVPCGRCLACLSNKRNDWTFRLVQEHKHSRSAFFVTLTYDWRHLPRSGSLSKRDVQLYLKRLRKADGTNSIRYYAVGEYGTKGNRPHYHLLLFNTDEKNIRGAWQLGIVHVGAVTVASVAYCTKYIVQPAPRPNNQEKPFALMSRAYGIGGHYLTYEMVEWHRSGHKSYTIVNGTKTRLPRYYRDKIWETDRDRSRVALKAKRYAMANARKEKAWYTDTYGLEEGKRKLKEFRNAELARIKTKVAFTQSL